MTNLQAHCSLPVELLRWKSSLHIGVGSLDRRSWRKLRGGGFRLGLSNNLQFGQSRPVYLRRYQLCVSSIKHG